MPGGGATDEEKQEEAEGAVGGLTDPDYESVNPSS